MEHIDDRKTILDLKAARIKKGYSYNMLADMTKEIGEPVAYSTISKVFGKDGENTSFNYINTLQPLVKILLDNESKILYDLSYKNEEDSESTDFQAALKAKDDIIEKLNMQIESLCNQVDFMKNQIQLKDNRMERKDSWIQEQREEIVELREENKKLEEDIHKLLEKCRVCGNGQVTNAGVNG